MRSSIGAMTDENALASTMTDNTVKTIATIARRHDDLRHAVFSESAREIACRGVQRDEFRARREKNAWRQAAIARPVRGGARALTGPAGSVPLMRPYSNPSVQDEIARLHEARVSVLDGPNGGACFRMVFQPASRSS